jgi:hypothetical protein
MLLGRESFPTNGKIIALLDIAPLLCETHNTRSHICPHFDRHFLTWDAILAIRQNQFKLNIAIPYKSSNRVPSLATTSATVLNFKLVLCLGLMVSVIYHGIIGHLSMRWDLVLMKPAVSCQGCSEIGLY